MVELDISIAGGNVKIWLNFCAEVKRTLQHNCSLTGRTKKENEILSRKYNAHYRAGHHSLVFKSEEDLTLFLLKYS